MNVSDYCLYFWLAPVILQIVIPLLILSGWPVIALVKK